MYNNGRRKRGEPECNEYNIQEERKTLQYFCGHAIAQYERGKMPEAENRFGLTKLFTLLETIGKDFKPLVRRQPQDFTIRLDSSFYAQRARNDLTTRGYEGIVGRPNQMRDNACPSGGEVFIRKLLLSRLRRFSDLPTGILHKIINASP